VDRVTRPIRLLLWMAENGELLESRSDLLEHGSAEIDALYRMVRVLVSQNKAGAQALEELEALRTALRSLREEVMRTGQHGVLPPIHSLPEGMLAEIGSSLQTRREQLMAFFRDLHERAAGLRLEVESLGKDLGFKVAGDLPPPTPLDPAAIEKARSAVGRCDRIATVLSLESRRVVPISGSPAGGGSARVQDLLGRVRAGLDDLGASLAEIESASAVVGNGIHFDAGRAHWVRLLEGLDALDRRLGEVDDAGTPAADAETTDMTEETT
jgi:hypothetical protein